MSNFREKGTPESRPCIVPSLATGVWVVSASSGFRRPASCCIIPRSVGDGLQAAAVLCRVLGDGFPREGACVTVAVPFTAHDALGVRTLKVAGRFDGLWVANHPRDRLSFCLR